MDESLKLLIKCPILSYCHFVSEEKEDMNSCTTADKFEKDIRLLLSNGYTSLSLHQIYLCKNKRLTWPEKPFCIIMDGGYESNYFIAFDILKKYKIHADIFITTDLVGMKNHPKYTNLIPHFSWKQASEMIKSGLVSIHSKWHDLDEDKGDLISIVKNKVDEIEKNLGTYDFQAFLYPQYNEDIIDKLYKNGIKIQIINYFKLNINNIKKGCVGRIPVYYTSNILDDIDEFTNIHLDNIEKEESISLKVNVDKTLNKFINKNIQSIELPIYKSPMICNYPRNAFPLSVLFVDNVDRYNNLIVTDYIDLVAETITNTLDYNNFNYIFRKRSCFEQYKIGADILKYNKIDILSYIYNGLINGFYSDIWLDSYYIPGKPAYKKYHLTHGLLIYGYNHENKEFHTMTYTNRGHYEELNVNCRNLIEGCSNKYFLYINLLKRDVTQRLYYDIKKIKNKLYNYLHSIHYDSDGAKEWDEYPNQYYGINACKWFGEYIYDIGNKKDEINLVNAYTFAEHKRCMTWRIKYIIEKEGLNYPQSESLCKNLNYYSDLILKLCIKYNYTKNVELAKRIVDYINLSINLESTTISALLNILDSK